MQRKTQTGQRVPGPRLEGGTSLLRSRNAIWALRSSVTSRSVAGCSLSNVSGACIFIFSGHMFQQSHGPWTWDQYAVSARWGKKTPSDWAQCPWTKSSELYCFDSLTETLDYLILKLPACFHSWRVLIYSRHLTTLQRKIFMTASFVTTHYVGVCPRAWAAVADSCPEP